MSDQRAPRIGLLGPSIGPLILAFGLALPLAALSGHVAPRGHVSTFEVGNDFVALLGLVWAAIQIVAHWRTPPSRQGSLRAAWISAALGALLITMEDHLALLVPSAWPGFLRPAASAAMWFAAASLMLACGRRYAMRRHVMEAMRAAFCVAMAAVGLALFLHAWGWEHPRGTLSHTEDLFELVATTLFVLGLFLTQLAPMKSYEFAPNEVGLRARRLFYDFGLETRRRYPTPYPVLALPGFRHLLTLAIAMWFMPGAAGAVRRVSGRSVRGQLFDLIRLGFVHGVDGKSYYVHDLYRPEQGSINETMTRVETKNGLNKTLQDLRADRPGPRDMNDKLEFFRACEAFGIPSAPIIATVEGGALIWMSPQSAFDRDLFVKDRKGRGGRFTLNFERVGPFLYRADDGAIIDFDEVVAALQAASADRRLIVQPKLQNHPEIRSLADKSLVVFRVMTCLDAHGEPQVTHGVLRLLRRFEPDWPKTADADRGCAIDVETGEFGLMTGDAPKTCTRWFAEHPVTGERVTGRRLDGWREIADVALAAHRVFSTRVLVGWDIGFTPDGPVILEGNSNPDFSYFQRVSRTPVGRSPLGPLLNVHLTTLTTRLIASASGSERARKPAAAAAPRKLLVATKRAADRFFERGVGGRAAGLLADARFALWRRSSPGGSYAAFYAHRAQLRLARGGAHKTLGLRHYRADPIAGAATHEQEDFAIRGQRNFRWFEERGLRSDMVCVDYGCGSLRVGQHFIRRLDPGCYIGLDVIDRFYQDGLTLLGPELVAEKRPYLSTIDAISIGLAARRNPDMIYSTAVLQHVPPAELDAYFGAVVAILGPHGVALANFKPAERTVRIGSSAWAHSFASLAAAVERIDPSLTVIQDPLPDLAGPDHPQAMLIVARAPDQIAQWARRE